MALNDLALCTVAEAETYLGLDSGTDTTLLQFLLNAASSALEGAYEVRLIAQGSIVDYHEGGSRRIWLRYLPVIAVASFVDPAGNSVPAADYRIEKDKGALIHLGSFPWAAETNGERSRWTITYSAGHFGTVGGAVEANRALVDAAVKQACLLMVQRGYEARGGDGSVQSASVGGLSVSYSVPAALEASAAMALSPAIASLMGPWMGTVV